MSDLRLRARSATEIVDAAFQVYRRDMVEYILITAIAYAPWVVVQLLILGGNALATPSLTPTQSLLTFALIVIGFFAFAVMTAVLGGFSSQSYLGRSADLGGVVREMLPKVWRIIGASVLFGLVMMFGMVPAIVGAVLQSIPLMALGVFFALGWAVYMFARFFAVFQVIVLEPRGVIAAFTRSSVLSKGRKWHILGTLILVFVIFGFLSLGISIIGGIAGSAVAAIVLQTLYTIVAYPLIGITQMILYYDTRIRAEGFDIEVLTDSLQTAAHTPGTAA